MRHSTIQIVRATEIDMYDFHERMQSCIQPNLITCRRPIFTIVNVWTFGMSMSNIWPY